MVDYADVDVDETSKSLASALLNAATDNGAGTSTNRPSSLP